MTRRAGMIFWTAVVVAVFLLGGGIATVGRVLTGGTVWDYVVLSVAVLGLTATLLVAGRILFVSARAQGRARRG